MEEEETRLTQMEKRGWPQEWGQLSIAASDGSCAQRSQLGFFVLHNGTQNTRYLSDERV